MSIQNDWLKMIFLKSKLIDVKVDVVNNVLWNDKGVKHVHLMCTVSMQIVVCHCFL